MSQAAKTTTRNAPGYGRVAVVTGAAMGIGAAIAERLGHDGHTVVVADINLAAAEEMVAGLRVQGIEAQAMAIERFKVKASEIARGFGFAGYTLREIAVTANDQGYVPRPRMMAMEAKASAADAPLPVEAGRSTVLVTVSGSVQMR